jgi:hypothetical protein
VASQNCLDEVGYALERQNPMLAIHLDDTELPPIAPSRWRPTTPKYLECALQCMECWAMRCSPWSWQNVPTGCPRTIPCCLAH